MIPQQPSTMAGARAGLSVLGLGATDRDRVIARIEAPSLIMTVESAIAEVTRGSATFMLDRSTCLLVPAGARVALRALAPASRVAILAFHAPLFARVARHHRRVGIDRARLERWVGRLELLPRTPWVHELVHRYVFERYALEEHDNETTRFLETELLKEIYFLFRDRDEGADRASAVRRHGPAVERAITHIESHLFEACTMRELAARAGASESTLLRAFRRELGSTPMAHWRARRLDEALVLLRSGRHAIAEVAIRVGYENPTAFGFAFRARFGRPASTFVPRRPARGAP